MFGFYKYDPSLTLCITALVLFTFPTLWHVKLLCTYRQNCKFFTPFVLGAIFQVIGFIARVVSIQNPTNSGVFRLQSVLILLAPIFYTLSINRLLPNIIKYITIESSSFSSPSSKSNKLQAIIMGAGILTLFLQIIGKNLSDHDTGNIFVLIGLAIQLTSFAFLLCLSIVFDIRTMKKPQTIIDQGRWRWLLRALELSSILLMVRLIYRLVEYAGKEDGDVMNNETLFYIFDALMMLLTQVIYNFVHPGAILTPHHVLLVRQMLIKILE